MELSVIERLRKYFKTKNLKNEEVANSIGMVNKTFSNKLAGARLFSINELNDILLQYEELSPEWLLTGKGSMLKSDNAPSEHSIRYYPSVYGSMGGIEFLDNPSEQCINLVLPNFPDSRFAINAYGDSMFPVIKSGQIIILREWDENFIDFGRIYLVVTKNGYRAIKYVKRGSDDEHILCKSENEENEPFEVALNDVYKLYMVDGWICKESI